jgi:hypothetical protein
MTRRTLIPLSLFLIVSSLCTRVLQAQQGLIADANSEMAAAAVKFWNSLSPDQQAKIHFEMNDPERMNWHFTPVTRKGLPWKEMTPLQRDLGHELLKSALSQGGYAKADAIQNLEATLKQIENTATAGSGDRRDPLNYYLTIFGKPGGADAWGWRFEGHHVAFNFTIAGDKTAAEVSGAPNFFGSNPAKVPDGYAKPGSRILAAEEDLGRQLVKSLNADQRKLAIFSETAPGEIITRELAKPDPINPTGIPAAQLNADQQKALHDLINEYTSRLRPELARQNTEKIEQAGFEKVYFAWAGTVEVGGPHYYRVQGPTFLIEYDDTQNNANHIHAVWRDANNDFGQDLLKRHYEQNPH